MASSVLSGQHEPPRFPAALQTSPLQEIPLEAQGFLREGLVHLQLGEAADAVAAFSRCVRYATGFADAHVFLGIAHALTNNIYPAIDHLEEAARLEQNSFAAHYAMAQLHFKLRIPQVGYEAAERAMRCVRTLEQRKMLTQLLREEKARERNGIARPWFHKPFSPRVLFLAVSSAAAMVVAFMAHMH